MHWELVDNLSCDNCHDSPLECLVITSEDDAYVATFCALCLVRMADYRSGFALVNVYRNILAQKTLRVPRSEKRSLQHRQRLEVINGKE